MSSLFSSGSSSSSSSSPSLSDSQARAEIVKNEVRQQLALANAQQLITSMNEKCYAKCITKPGLNLSPADESCITRCSDRFLEAFDIVSRTYITRVSKEKELNQAGGMGGEGLM